jgi:hypothetical protein
MKIKYEIPSRTILGFTIAVLIYGFVLLISEIGAPFWFVIALAVIGTMFLIYIQPFEEYPKIENNLGVKLISDMLNIPTMKAIFWEDIGNIMKKNSNLRLATFQASIEEIKKYNVFLENDIQLQNSPAFLVGFYIHKDTHIKVISELEKQISQCASENALYLTNAFIINPPRLPITEPFPLSEIKIVILY